ncbi:MAG: DUF881 domain-containing protein [Ruminococcaceae bacterium]|nr:DUF881 domain-containing protein [Oscillospiraceae bacterium]
MIKRKWIFEFAISVLIFVLVFAFTWQFKGVKKNTEIRSREKIDKAEIQQSLYDAMEKNEKLKLEIESLKEENVVLRDETASENDYLSVINERLSQTELYAGLTDVKGKGLVITMKDVPLTGEMKESGLYNNYGTVHDINILKIVNELKAAGAEAISVNGERIVAMTEVRCVGPTIMINQERVGAPYEIKAIGDPDTLESALRMNGGAIEEATRIYGIAVTTKKEDEIFIDKYVGLTKTDYAETADEKGEEK